VYALGEFWVPEINDRGRDSRSLATTGARVKRARRRERARAQTCRSCAWIVRISMNGRAQGWRVAG
jgi:hypothetical protein